MRMILKSRLMILLVVVGTFAQVQPTPQAPTTPRFPQPVAYNGSFGQYGVAQQPAKPSTNNYHLELTIQRGNKTAAYKLALNSGSLTTELMDRFAEPQEGMPPQTISLNAVLSPFDEGGGEVTLTLNRYITYKTKAQPQGRTNPLPPAASEKEKEVTASKSIPLMTKVALFPGRSVVIFADEAERISIKLTELGSDREKP